VERNVDPDSPNHTANISDASIVAPIIAGQNTSQNANKLSLASDSEDENTYRVKDSSGNYLPISASPFISAARRTRERRVGQGGRNNLAMPDHVGMLSANNKWTKDVYGKNDLKPSTSLSEAMEDQDTQLDLDGFHDSIFRPAPRIPGELLNMFEKFDKRFGKNRSSDLDNLLNESDSEMDEIDLEIIEKDDNDENLVHELAVEDAEKEQATPSLLSEVIDFEKIDQ